MHDYERLGVFYLGRSGETPLLYQSRHLTTHGVCVGMTGSGKTGLCVSLIEEAAIDGIPVLAIDPKGDLPNLMLQFPELRGSDFQPWVDADAARRAGQDIATFAESEAGRWRAGLAEWHQDGVRIARLHDTAEVTVYTPGSNAGRPLAVLGSFAAPGPAIADDAELLAERVSAAVSAVLGLLGIDGDPLTSREHLLLSVLFDHSWSTGRDLDPAELITQIQQPPVTRVGVMDIDVVFPPADRFTLAMRLNQLLASPAFQLWTQGEALDLDRLLYTPAGKPRVAIISIAHLGERERMFVVASLLGQALAWTRRQTGSDSLRALIYFDEIAGYLPPVANPPSKAALLTLLKQARAFGVGVLVATQNPVDLDYKALANCGTWLVGTLQTERDRDRVLDALGAVGGADRAELQRRLAGLGKRQFLLHDIHEAAPLVFESRWAMSYLRGPMTREQIRSVMGNSPALSVRPTIVTPPQSAAPALPPGIPQRFAPIRGVAAADATVILRPALVGTATLYWRDPSLGLDTRRDVRWRLPLDTAPTTWDGSSTLPYPINDCTSQAPPGATWSNIPTGCTAAWFADIERTFADALFRREQLALLRSPSLGLTARPDEDERAFRIRCAQLGRERRDANADTLRRKYAPKFAALEERVRRAESARQREQSQVRQADLGTALSFGTSLLGALFGRKTLSAANVGRVASAARSVGRSSKERGDVERAEAEIAHHQSERQHLEDELAAEIAAVGISDDRFDNTNLPVKKGDIRPGLVAIVWEPWWHDHNGERPAW